MLYENMKFMKCPGIPVCVSLFLPNRGLLRCNAADAIAHCREMLGRRL